MLPLAARLKVIRSPVKSLTRVSQPETEPVTLIEAKAFLRVTHVKDDAYVTGLISMARMAVEDFTRRAFIEQEWLLTMDSWPVASRPTHRTMQGRRIELDRSPVLDVSSVKYYPADDSAQATLSEDDYIVAKGLIPGILQIKSGSAWPALACRPDAVEISFTAGHEDAELILLPLRQAILLIIAHFYETRTPVNVGNLVTEVPLGLQWLLQSYRVSGYLT